MKYNKILRLSVMAILLSSAVAVGFARPAKKGTATLRQPDGSTITVRLHGDEFLHFTTTTDGYTVVKCGDGYYRYATVVDGQLSATGVVARNLDERSADESLFLQSMEKMVKPEMSEGQKAMKEGARRLYGNNLLANNTETAHSDARRIGGKRIDYSKFKGLVILVEFNDRKFLREDAQEFYQMLTSKKELTSYTNIKGNVIQIDGSVRDYFRDNSMGMFDPTFDVVGPISIPYSCTDPKGGNNIINILKAALSAANSEVNYAEYDLDKNGYADMVYFIFAGYGSYVSGNNKDYVWPHASDLTYQSRRLGLRFDGVMFSRYACSVEIADQESLADVHQTLDGIGTMCHEFSHVLGLADHYDTDYEKNGQVEHPGPWDVMAGGADYNGGYTPAGYNAYERYSLGFAPLQTIDVAGKYELEPFNTSNQFYRIATGTKKEFFYVENRQNTGWDRFLPGHGLLVWRVDSTNNDVWDNNTVNCNPEHSYYELLKAVPGKTYYSGYTPFPGAGNVTDVTADSPTPLLSWAGQEAVVDLYDIFEHSDGSIIFNAGKNLYSSQTENFEQMDYTTTDAVALQGVFTNWNLDKTIIANAATEGYGNGEHVARMNRSGVMTTAVFNEPLRDLSFQVWCGDLPAKITLRENSSGRWQKVKTNEGLSTISLKKGDSMTCIYHLRLPAGAQLQIQMQATSADAVAYVDDLVLTYDNPELSGINDIKGGDNACQTKTFNLRGQRVDGGYRGIVVRGGKKYVMR